MRRPVDPNLPDRPDRPQLDYSTERRVDRTWKMDGKTFLLFILLPLLILKGLVFLFLRPF